MIVLVFLRPFLTILIFFEFRAPVHTLCSEQDGPNMAKTSKIRENTCFLPQNAENSCQKVLETPFSRDPIIFLRFASDSPSNFGLKKCINSILEILRFLDTLTPFCRFENHTFLLENSE